MVKAVEMQKIGWNIRKLMLDLDVWSGLKV